MKFGDLLKGTRARETVKAQLGGVEYTVDLRVLSLPEEMDVIVRARRYAESLGVVDAGENNPVYLTGLHVSALALACIDHESPEDAPTPFFGGGEKQILSEPTITQDEVEFLFALYQFHADERSLRKRHLNEVEFRALMETAGADGASPLPFLELSPGTQWSCFHSMAALCSLSLRDRSVSSTPSAASPTTPPS